MIIQPRGAQRGLDKKPKERNALVLSNDAMVLQGDIVINFVFKACTKEYLEGLAYKVVELLMKKHWPLDTLSRVEL